MTTYRPRLFTYQPLALVADAEKIASLGLSPTMIAMSSGPDAVVVYCVETDAAHPAAPILPSMAEFEARYEAVPE